MTEAEWLVCTDPAPMQEYLRDKVSDRKLRLFAVACCRRIWHLIPAEKAKWCVEVAEQHADGSASNEELEASIRASMQACNVARHQGRLSGNPWGRVEAEAINAVGRVHRTEGEGRSGTMRATALTWAIAEMLKEGRIVSVAERLLSLQQDEQGRQTALLRDIFGNPFRPVTLSPSWLTPAVKPLAQAIYDNRAFDSLPVLADALEEAGCANANLIAHCREPGPHVRGCWAVDLLLGKE